MFRMKQKPILNDNNRTEKRKIGDLGEKIACDFLVEQGFRIIERNYLRKWGEIDIIAQKGHKLHFVEVKTVSCEILASRNKAVLHEKDRYRPEDNVHSWKLERLGRVIQTYLMGTKDVSYVTRGEIDWQFDIIAVYLDMKIGKSKVEYLENIII